MTCGVVVYLKDRSIQLPVAEPHLPEKKTQHTEKCVPQAGNVTFSDIHEHAAYQTEESI